MQLIYIHGFNSNAASPKGQMLADWCAAHRPDISVQRPDLNLPPQQVMQHLQSLIAQDHSTGLVGSSLGGFYASACVANYGVKAVLVNPSVRPFERFKRFFQHGATSYTNETGWTVTPDQLDDLAKLYHAVPPQPDKLLVLLKQGDEVLDYREAEQYFSQAQAQSALIVEPGGNHFMDDMDSKIPLMIDFLFNQ